MQTVPAQLSQLHQQHRVRRLSYQLLHRYATWRRNMHILPDCGVSGVPDSNCLQHLPIGLCGKQRVLSAVFGRIARLPQLHLQPQHETVHLSAMSARLHFKRSKLPTLHGALPLMPQLYLLLGLLPRLYLQLHRNLHSRLPELPVPSQLHRLPALLSRLLPNSKQLPALPDS